MLIVWRHNNAYAVDLPLRYLLSVVVGLVGRLCYAEEVHVRVGCDFDPHRGRLLNRLSLYGDVRGLFVKLLVGGSSCVAGLRAASAVCGGFVTFGIFGGADGRLRSDGGEQGTFLVLALG